MKSVEQMNQQTGQKLRVLLLNRSAKYFILKELENRESYLSALCKKINRTPTQVLIDIKILLKIGAIEKILPKKQMRGARIPKDYIGSWISGKIRRVKRNTKYYGLTERGKEILKNLIKCSEDKK